MIPTVAAGSRHVVKRTALDLEFLQLRVQRTQKLLAEAGPDSAGEFEPFAFVKIDKQRAEMFPTAFGIGISADYELLLQVQLDLDPRSGAFAGLVPGAAAFTDQPLKPECPGLFQKLFNVFREADRISKCGWRFCKRFCQFRFSLFVGRSRRSLPLSRSKSKA